MATNQKLPSLSKAPPSRNLPCGWSWMSANRLTGPMPGGGGGRPQGWTCSGAGGPASGGGVTDWDCAEAVGMEAMDPQSASKRTEMMLVDFVDITISSDALPSML